MDGAAQYLLAMRYIEAIDPQHRALFDRIHGLIVRRYPGVSLGLSYGMPVYRANGRSLSIGVWKHGVSCYGMEVRSAVELIERYGLPTGKGTVRLRDGDAVSMSDDDLGALLDRALGDRDGGDGDQRVDGC